PYKIMELYGMIDDNLDDYLGDFDYGVVEGSKTLTEAFSSTNIRQNIQTSSNFSTLLESKNKGAKINIQNLK
ncbi:40515_t:CDS:1, partial [Gigaspora margarita]